MMIEVVRNIVQHQMCEPCRLRAKGEGCSSECPHPNGCEEYSDAAEAARLSCAAVLAVLQADDAKTPWRLNADIESAMHELKAGTIRHP